MYCPAKRFFATAEASVSEIDEINIFHASGLAMTRSFFKSVLTQIKKDSGTKVPELAILIDGNRIPRQLKVFQEKYLITPIIKGDTKVFFDCSCQYFCQKNARDGFMKKLATDFRGYGWETNVGYPTPAHKDAVKRLGPTNWHRRSFNLNF